MKRLDEDQYIAMTNLNMLTVITDALRHVLPAEDGVINATELERMTERCWQWLRRYHEMMSGEDEREDDGEG